MGIHLARCMYICLCVVYPGALICVNIYLVSLSFSKILSLQICYILDFCLLIYNFFLCSDPDMTNVSLCWINYAWPSFTQYLFDTAQWQMGLLLNLVCISVPHKTMHVYIHTFCNRISSYSLGVSMKLVGLHFLNNGIYISVQLLPLWPLLCCIVWWETSFDIRVLLSVVLPLCYQNIPTHTVHLERSKNNWGSNSVLSLNAKFGRRYLISS